MERRDFIKTLAGGGAIITTGAYAGLFQKRIYHAYGNEPDGHKITGGIVPELGGKPIPDGDVKKVAICATDIPFIRSGFSLRGKNGETLAYIQAGSMVHVVFGKKPFRLYLLHSPDEKMKDKEYCIFRLAYNQEWPEKCLPLWDGDNGFTLYVRSKELGERAKWWEARGNLARMDLDRQMGRFIAKGNFLEKPERS